VKVSDKLIEMIKHDEGVKTRPYQCPALLWTVGVGHVIDPNHAKVKLADRKQLPIPDGWDRVLPINLSSEVREELVLIMLKWKVVFWSSGRMENFPENCCLPPILRETGVVLLKNPNQHV